MAAEPDRGRDRQSDLAVMDANELKQKRRLDEILNEQDRVKKATNKTFEEYVSGQTGYHGKNISIQFAVQRFIREVYVLLQEAEEDEPELYKKYWLGEATEPLGEIKFETKQNRVIQGLKDFFELDSMITETVERTVNRRNKSPTVEVEEIQHTVDHRVSLDAYLDVKMFLYELHGLEMSIEELEDKLPTWGFEEVERDESE